MDLVLWSPDLVTWFAPVPILPVVLGSLAFAVRGLCVLPTHTAQQELRRGYCFLCNCFTTVKITFTIFFIPQFIYMIYILCTSSHNTKSGIAFFPFLLMVNPVSFPKLLFVSFHPHTYLLTYLLTYLQVVKFLRMV